MMGLTQLGQMLHEEHQRTLSLLNSLESRILGPAANVPLSPDSDDDRRQLKTVIDVVDQDVDRHFGFEEEVLFPLLAEHGASDMTEMLMQEHELIRPLAARIKELALQALDGGLDDTAWGDFKTLGMELVEREMFHIQKEEMGLVQGLSYFLDPDTDRELSLRYAEVRG